MTLIIGTEKEIMDWKEILEQLHKKLSEDLSSKVLTNKEDLVHLHSFFELTTSLLRLEIDRREKIDKLLTLQ